MKLTMALSTVPLTLTLVVIGQVVKGVIFAAVVLCIVAADRWLPDSAEVELAKWYRGQRRRREKRGYTD